jgi:hypothetical protein
MGVTKQFEPQRLADGRRYEDLPRGNAENGEILATDKRRISTDLHCHNRSTLLPSTLLLSRCSRQAAQARQEGTNFRLGRKDTKMGRQVIWITKPRLSAISEQNDRSSLIRQGSKRRDWQVAELLCLFSWVTIQQSGRQSVILAFEAIEVLGRRVTKVNLDR